MTQWCPLGDHGRSRRKPWSLNLDIVWCLVTESHLKIIFLNSLSCIWRNTFIGGSLKKKSFYYYSNFSALLRSCEVPNSDTMWYVSHLMCHMSHITCHMSPVTCIFFSFILEEYICFTFSSWTHSAHFMLDTKVNPIMPMIPKRKT